MADAFRRAPLNFSTSFSRFLLISKTFLKFDFNCLFSPSFSSNRSLTSFLAFLESYTSKEHYIEIFFVGFFSLSI